MRSSAGIDPVAAQELVLGADLSYLTLGYDSNGVGAFDSQKPVTYHRHCSASH